MAKRASHRRVGWSRPLITDHILLQCSSQDILPTGNDDVINVISHDIVQ